MDSGPIRVLLIEDNPLDVHMVREMLGNAAAAFVVEEAGLLSAGLERLAGGGIDVVLLDLSLPDSRELETFVKTQAQAPHVPIVVLSAIENEVMAVEAVEKGAQDYLVKGQVDGRALVRAVRYAIERKRAEEEARVLVELLDASPASITVHDYDGSFIYANQKTLDLHGYTRDEFMAINLHQLDVPESERLIAPRMQELVERGEASFEVVHYRKDSTTVPLHVNAKVARWGGREVILSIAADITERKQAEERLRESEVLYHSLVETSQDLIWRCDADGRFTFLNKSWEKTHGYTVEEMLGRCFTAFQRPEAAARDMQEFQRHLAGGLVTGYEITHVSKSGDDIHLVFNAMPLFDADGRVVGTQGAAYDITTRKRAEEALQQYAERLRALTARLAEAEESERRRIARDLHDRVGQNLTALGINLNIARTQMPEEAGLARSRLDDALALVDETTERIRSVMADLRPPVLDDYGLVAALRWHGERFASRTGIAVTIQGEEPDPRLAAHVEHALFRIAQEALTNVSKHARATQAMVRVEEGDATVRLTVEDDGIGFEPADLAGPDAHIGWGLLSMAERAEAVGGQCRVESRPGQGTRVLVEVAR